MKYIYMSRMKRLLSSMKPSLQQPNNVTTHVALFLRYQRPRCWYLQPNKSTAVLQNMLPWHLSVLKTPYSSVQNILHDTVCMLLHASAFTHHPMVAPSLKNRILLNCGMALPKSIPFVTLLAATPGDSTKGTLDDRKDSSHDQKGER